MSTPEGWQHSNIAVLGQRKACDRLNDCGSEKKQPLTVTRLIDKA